MDPAEKFLKFAAECEFMAKFTHIKENKIAWHRMAERWTRCAELARQQATATHEAHYQQRRNRHAHASHASA